MSAFCPNVAMRDTLPRWDIRSSPTMGAALPAVPTLRTRRDADDGKRAQHPGRQAPGGLSGAAIFATMPGACRAWSDPLPGTAQQPRTIRQTERRMPMSNERDARCAPLAAMRLFAMAPRVHANANVPSVRHSLFPVHFLNAPA